MREFIYYSRKAHTKGNFKDLMQAGRLDIAIHTIISSFFLSNKLREDVTLHMIFDGPPDPPKHLEFVSDPEMPISKKDVSKLLKIMLYKYRQGKKIKVFPGCFIEKKSLQALIKELAKNKEIYLLEKKGEDIRTINFGDNPIFILGDQEGIPKDELKFIKRYAKPISLGNLSYFSSQVVTLINNELDRKLYK